MHSTKWGTSKKQAHLSEPGISKDAKQGENYDHLYYYHYFFCTNLEQGKLQITRITWARFSFFLRSLYLQQKGFWWGQQTLHTLLPYTRALSDMNMSSVGKKEEKKQTNIYIHLGLEDHDVPRRDHRNWLWSEVQVRRVHACPLLFNKNILLMHCLSFDQGNRIQHVKMCVSVLHYFYCRDPETSGVKDFSRITDSVITTCRRLLFLVRLSWNSLLVGIVFFFLFSLFNFSTAVCVYVLWWDINVLLWAR